MDSATLLNTPVGVELRLILTVINNTAVMTVMVFWFGTSREKTSPRWSQGQTSAWACQEERYYCSDIHQTKQQ